MRGAFFIAPANQINNTTTSQCYFTNDASIFALLYIKFHSVAKIKLN